MIDLKAAFEKYEFEHLTFERVKKPLHRCPDIAAFLLLDNLVPTKNGRDMIRYVDSDCVHLNVNLAKLARVITKKEVKTLIRCGILYSAQYNCLTFGI